MSLHTWVAFFLTSLVIAITPGPGAILSLSNGLKYCYLTALKGLAGLEVALFIQLAVVMLGLGAVLKTSHTAFLVLKVTGAVYLIWLGIKKWREKIATEGQAQTGQLIAVTARQRDNLFLQGLFVNLTNPKAVLFIVALVPQFVDAQAPQFTQFAILSSTMIMTDVAVMSCYILLAGQCRIWLRNPSMLRLVNRVFGGIFIAAGTLLFASSR